jgi:ABC-type long-subunit fatty acid transport system fused permease/ATPase subunit
MNFWDHHGILFLLGVTFFPRITTLFFASVSFGFWAILGWIFTPHLLVAIYATTYYWDSNPILCIIAWCMALLGTGGEGVATKKATSK